MAYFQSPFLGLLRGCNSLFYRYFYFRPPAANEEAPISPVELRLTEAISKAMSKEVAPLIANRDLTRARHTVYKGTKDGTVDGWLPVMKRFLERVHAKWTKIDKARAIIDRLEGEARNFIINKCEPERD